MKALTLAEDLKHLKNSQYTRVIGIDEVGRGSWAGPVAVGAYILDSKTQLVNGVYDSKGVSQRNRVSLNKKLSTYSHSIHLGSVAEINRVGIGKVISNLIREIIEIYNSSETLFLIDGQFSTDFGTNTLKIIRGDTIYYSVAAASIIAKVFRDNLMRSLHKEFPQFAFESNVGYPTKKHLEALQKYGPSEIHRRSFKPIQNFINI